MKKTLSVLLSISMIIFLLSGCGSGNISNSSMPAASVPSNESSSQNSIEPTNEIVAENDKSFNQEISSDSVAPENPTVFDWEEDLEFTGMSDEALLPYLEDSVYTQLVKGLDNTEYYVENVSAVYVSQEYLRELDYNSQTNVFFGYSLAELDSFFEGTRYVFTLGKDGQTTVEPLMVVEDTTYEQILKNVAIGTGVILICVTITYVTAGVGAPAANAIFAAAAKTGAMCARIGLEIGGISNAIVKAYQTGDFKEALKAGALGASEGYKWGAIVGAVSGGADKALGLYSATANGLTMNQVATIQKESGFPLKIIKQFHTFEEYTVFKDAGLQAEMLSGKLTLVRSDIDLYNIVDEYGRNNYTRLSKGLNPIDSTGKTFEWHHIGQTNDATLSLLTSAEHDSGALHGFKVISEIDRDAFSAFKKVLNKALLKWLLGNS